jgi:hypothetical protein
LHRNEVWKCNDLTIKNAAVMIRSDCKGCGNNDVLYGRMKEHTVNIRLSKKAIFLEL